MQHHPHTSRRRLGGAALTVVAMLATLLTSAPASAEPPTSNTQWNVAGLADTDQVAAVPLKVRAIANVGDIVYVGGRYTTVTGPNGEQISQPFLAAFDRASGTWRSDFRPTLDGAVYSIVPAADGQSLFIGGEFSSINGAATGTAARIGLDGNLRTAYDIGATGAGKNYVHDLEIDGDHLIVGGEFRTVDGVVQPRLARIAQADGSIDTTFDPAVTGGAVWAVEVSDSFDRIYLGGQFQSVNNDGSQRSFAAVDRSGDLQSPGGFVLEDYEAFQGEMMNAFDLIETGTSVIVANQSNTLIVLDKSSLEMKHYFFGEDFRDVLPYKGSDYQAIGAVGGRVFVGTHMRWTGTPQQRNGNGHVDSRDVTRHEVNVILELDGAGNQQDSFLPMPLTGSVWEIADVGNGCFWFGGNNLDVQGVTDLGFGEICLASADPLNRSFGPFDNAYDYANQQYLDFFGRSGDAEGIRFWAERTEGDAAKADDVLAELMLQREVQNQRQIIRFYLGLFDRTPDIDGLAYWTGQRNAGVSPTTIADGFLASDEFAELVGTVDNREFARQVYRRVLDREPDAAGLDYWTAQLDNGLPREDLMIGFTESAEFIASTDARVSVTVVYAGMLRRLPDADREAFWTSRVGATGDARELIATIFNGDEYRNRFDR